MLPQSSDICFTKSSDMLNKNTLGVKKVRGQSEATCKKAGAQPKALISAEAKKLATLSKNF